MAKAKWSELSIVQYRACGEQMAMYGAKAICEVDGPNNSQLTFWATPSGLSVTQVFRDTGDVAYLRNVYDAKEACQKEAANG